MKKAEAISTMIEIVRQSRDATSNFFPLPDKKSCVEYAVTEAAEYIDALLRENRKGDKRNNEKNHKAIKELGQCGYMICSAIIQEPSIDPKSFNLYWQKSDNVYKMILMFGSYLKTYDTLWPGINNSPSLLEILDEYVSVCSGANYDAVSLMAETCIDFEDKHLPKIESRILEKISKAKM